MESTFAVSERLTTRQRQLVDELVDLFLAEGFARLTLDEVAARLGCSKRTLYALADSKEQLAVRAVRFFFKRATDQVESAIARHPLPGDQGDPLSGGGRRGAPAGRGGVPPRPRPDRRDPRRSTSRTPRAAAVRVRELIDEGIRAGAFRHVSAAFVGEVVTATMRRITSGEIGGRPGWTTPRPTRSWPVSWSPRSGADRAEPVDRYCDQGERGPAPAGRDPGQHGCSRDPPGAHRRHGGQPGRRAGDGPDPGQRPVPDQRPGHPGAVVATHDHQPRQTARGRRTGAAAIGPPRRPGLADRSHARSAGSGWPRSGPGWARTSSPCWRRCPRGTARRCGPDWKSCSA